MVVDESEFIGVGNGVYIRLLEVALGFTFTMMRCAGFRVRLVAEAEVLGEGSGGVDVEGVFMVEKRGERWGGEGRLKSKTYVSQH